MKSEIRRFGVVRAGTVGAILYGFFGLVFLPFGAIVAIADSSAGLPFVLMVLLYPVMGFIGGLLFAALYNLAARIGGGLHIELSQVQEGYEPLRPATDALGPSANVPAPERRPPGDERTYAPPGYYD